MSVCGWCGRAFNPGDEIELSAVQLPLAIAALASLARPYLSRLMLFRCSAPECGGMVTALYLPRTAALPEKGADHSPGMPFFS